MQITETRVKLVDDRNDRLKAFCSITFDEDFVVRDLKIIEGTSGYFVAMPSRKLTDHCPNCGNKNHLRAKHCNECGKRLKESRDTHDDRRSPKLHADIAHPVNTETRQYIQNTVVEAFKEELERSKSPDYQPTTPDDLENYETPIPAETPLSAEMAPSEIPPIEPFEEEQEKSEEPPSGSQPGFGEGIF
jgi:stage V sporulation protein G